MSEHQIALELRRVYKKFLQHISKFETLAKSERLVSFAENCIQLTERMAANPGAVNFKENLVLLKSAIPIFQSVLISTYERTEPSEKILASFELFEKEVIEILAGTSLEESHEYDPNVIDITSDLMDRKKTQSTGQELATYESEINLNPELKRFQEFLEMSRFKQPTLVYEHQTIEKAYLDKVKILKNNKPLTQETKETETESKFKKILSVVKSSFSSKFNILLYFFVAYIFFSLWMFLKQQNTNSIKNAEINVAPIKVEEPVQSVKVEDLNKADKADVPVKSEVLKHLDDLIEKENHVVHDNHVIRDEPRKRVQEEPKDLGPFLIARKSYNVTRTNFVLADKKVSLKESSLSVSLKLSKAKKTENLLEGFFVLLTKGPVGIFTYPKEAVSFENNTVSIMPSMGKEFSYRMSQTFEASVDFAGSSIVEAFFFSKSGKLIGYSKLNLSIQKQW